MQKKHWKRDSAAAPVIAKPYNVREKSFDIEKKKTWTIYNISCILQANKSKLIYNNIR